MRLLALDASTEALSVALIDSAAGGMAREHFEIAPRAHAQRLLPIADDMLTGAGWSLRDLDGLAFGRGPGAFTGLRIAAGLVQGLASGLGRSVVPVSTLAAIAARCFEQGTLDRVRVVQDARMGEIYTADYVRGDRVPRLIGAERVIEPSALVLDDTQALLRGGNGWHLVEHDPMRSNVIVESPHAIDIVRLAAVEFAAGNALPPAEALPVYVRDDVARKPARR